MIDKVKYITENGTFYIDHSDCGMISVDETTIKNVNILIKDIEKAVYNFKYNKKLSVNRSHTIKKLLND